VTYPRISDRERRLRTRIDELRDQRDALADERDQIMAEAAKLQALVAALEQEPRHMNQYGPCAVYNTPEERQAARRRTWRESKRRKAAG